MELNNSDATNPDPKLKTRICPHCKQPYQLRVGLKNINNLFRKPTLDEIITLAILFMVIAAAYAYQYDTKTCKETLKNIEGICLNYCQGLAREVAYNSNYSLQMNKTLDALHNLTFVNTPHGEENQKNQTNQTE